MVLKLKSTGAPLAIFIGHQGPLIAQIALGVLKTLIIIVHGLETALAKETIAFLCYLSILRLSCASSPFAVALPHYTSWDKNLSQKLQVL